MKNFKIEQKGYMKIPSRSFATRDLQNKSHSRLKHEVKKERKIRLGNTRQMDINMCNWSPRKSNGDKVIEAVI